ncbi:PA14 domain-containing protein [Thermodesulfobacteriota bacterium]
MRLSLEIFEMLNALKLKIFSIGMIFLVIGLLSGCAGIGKSESLLFAGLPLVAPQPPAESLKPGLSVLYFYDYFWRDLDPDKKGAFWDLKGVPGEKPILEINHQFKKNLVFDSGVQEGIGMRMTGFIRFPKTGTYSLQALVNDGIRVFIGERMVIDDTPQLYGDRFTDVSIIEIGEIGFYTIKVEYFQRKGTAAIKLLWKVPGEEDFVPVPAESYSHLNS